jgi:hypothetical protein
MKKAQSYRPSAPLYRPLSSAGNIGVLCCSIECAEDNAHYSPLAREAILVKSSPRSAKITWAAFRPGINETPGPG